MPRYTVRAAVEGRALLGSNPSAAAAPYGTGGAPRGAALLLLRWPQFSSQPVL